MGSDAEVTWESDDRLAIDGVRYTLMNERPGPGDLCLYKPRVMVEAYEPIIAEFDHMNMVELGIYGGGSTAYFAQRCAPRRLVAIDRSPNRVPGIDRFLEDHGLRDQVTLHYGVDQADRQQLRSIVADAFGEEPLDLVIDDASHEYGPTVESFEELFPLLRPGGLYVIEDWTADNWLEIFFRDLVDHEEPLARAVAEQWLAAMTSHPVDASGRSFERWVHQAVVDPASPDHERVQRWRRQLERRDASQDAQVLAERVAARLEAGLGDLAGPRLDDLARQLLGAVQHLHAGIAEVAVNSWWIAVRRGGPIDRGSFSVATMVAGAARATPPTD